MNFVSVDPGLSGAMVIWRNGKPLSSHQWEGEHQALFQLGRAWVLGARECFIESQTVVGGQNPRNQAKLAINGYISSLVRFRTSLCENRGPSAQEYFDPCPE